MTQRAHFETRPGVLLSLLVALAASVPVAPASASPGAVRDSAFADRLDEIRQLQRDGQDHRAEQLARGLLADVEATLGPGTRTAAETLDLLVRALYRNGKRRRAETLELAERAVELRRRLHGEDSLEHAASLHQLGQLMHSASDFERARDLFARSLDIRRRLAGDDHPLVAHSLQSLGLVIEEMGEVEEGRALLERALALREASAPELGLASLVNDLAGLIYRQGDYRTALAYYRRSLALYEELLAPGHPWIGKALHNVGVLHHVLGEIDQAFVFYGRALEIYLATRGADHPVTASTHTALAMLHQDAGDFTAARRHFEAAVHGLGQGLGTDHPRYAVAVSELGLLLEDSGDYEEAERLQRRALEVRRDALGERHPDYGQSLARVGGLALRQGRSQRAELYLRTALEIQQAALGPSHPELVATLRDLATLSAQAGDEAAARQYLRRAVEIVERDRADHPELAEPLAQLARLTADPEEASGLIARALNVLEAAFGHEHPQVAPILEHRARLRAAAGRRTEALEDALNAAALARDHVRQTILAMAERHALDFARRHAAPRDLSLDLLLRYPSSAEDVAAVWDAVIRSRALVLDAVMTRNETLRAAADPRSSELAADLAARRRRLTNLWVRQRSELPPARHAELIRQARDDVDSLEVRLADASEPLLRARRRRLVGLAQVMAAMPPHTALVAAARFEEHGEGHEEARYAAFVLPSGAAHARLVDLGPASRLDQLVARWRALLTEGFGTAPDAEENLNAVGRDLRRALWDPLARHLGEGARQVFLVPDGALHLVPPAALPTDGGRYLAEDGLSVHLLTAERDVVELQAPARLGKGILAVGGPDFNDRSRFAALTPAPARPSSWNSRLAAALGFLGRGWKDCASFAEQYFLPLPESLREVDDISGVLPAGSPSVVRLTAGRASEGRVKAIASGYRILHFATHGFVLDPECSARPLAALGRSGLALAGANYRRAAGRSEEDGILTAEEIAGLDLDGVEWAVLSACETGLGEIRAGEGVLGLRRAFTVAGARTVVMSLWSVDDESTRQWMRELYAARFGAELSVIEAVRQASLSVLADRRAAGLSSHPVYWAGFVASGDWE